MRPKALRDRHLRPWIIALALLCLAGRSHAAGEDWIEVRSPNFVVASNAGGRIARKVAREFEQIRSVFLMGETAKPDEPVTILAVKDEKSLKSLIPQYWEKKGDRPAGIFQRSPVGGSIAMRVTFGGRASYRIVYHEYYHYLADLNIGPLPWWLAEGLATFWENTAIREKAVETGIPDPDYVRTLRGSQMIPMEKFITMATSPYETDAHRVGTYYAQAWAMTHYILVGDETGASRQALMSYLQNPDRMEDAAAAFTAAFGDISEFEKTIRKYVRQSSLKSIVNVMSRDIENLELETEALSPAEAAAVRGRFLICGARPEAGLPLLDEAIKLDSACTAAYESEGLYYLMKDRREEAARWFSEAKGLNSTWYYCYYYSAENALMMNGEERTEEIERDLLRTIDLNPRFAKAYAGLAYLYERKGTDLDKAFAMAREAIKLEPGNTSYWARAARIVLRLKRPVDARGLAVRALKVAHSKADKELAGALLADIEAYLAETSGQHGTSPEGQARAGAPASVEPEGRPPEKKQAPEPGEQARKAAEKSTRKVEGRFTELRCPENAGLDFVITSEGVTYVLRAAGPLQVFILAEGQTVKKALYCGPQHSLVRVRYVFDPKKSTPSLVRGTINTLEFLKEP